MSPTSRTLGHSATRVHLRHKFRASVNFELVALKQNKKSVTSVSPVLRENSVSLKNKRRPLVYFIIVVPWHFTKHELFGFRSAPWALVQFFFSFYFSLVPQNAQIVCDLSLEQKQQQSPKCQCLSASIDGALVNSVWTTPCSVPLNGPLLQASVTVQPSNSTRSQRRQSPALRRTVWGLQLKSLRWMPGRAPSILFRISFCIFLQLTFNTHRDARFAMPYNLIARCDKLTLRFCIRCGFDPNNVLESSHSRQPIKDHEKEHSSLVHSDLVRWLRFASFIALQT